MPQFKKDRTILNINAVKQELDNAEIYEDEDGNKIQTIYLGSILNLTPSGKFYTPFANSNVDHCQRCEGTGSIKNKHGQITKMRRITKYIRELTNEWETPYRELTKHQQNKINKLRKMKEHYSIYVTCPECRGLGSLEARLDQDWWEQLESELDEIEAYSHGSEGDGCDVMISRVLQDAAEQEERQNDRR
jgi:hypothetical protein